MLKAMSRLPLLAALAFLAACQSGGTGSSSETESTIIGQVFYPGDVPVADARVSLLPTTHIGGGAAAGPDSLIADTRTDAEGRFTFTGVQTGFYALAVQKIEGADTLGLQTQVEVGTAAALVQLTPQRLGAGHAPRFALTAPDGLGPKARIFLYGQDWTDTSDDSGRFALPSLPPGLNLLRIVPASPALGVLEIPFHADSGLGTLALERDASLRVADFEHRETATPFSVAFPKGKWFSSDNLSATGGPQTFEPASIRSDFASAYTDSGAWRGHSLHVGVKLLGSPAAAYGLVGFAIGDGQSGVDFTAMDSIVFYAKGTGTLRLEFQTAAVLKDYHDWRHFRKVFALAAGWTRISIPVSELTLQADSPALKGGLTWGKAGRNVVNVVFLTDDPADFWLDDLVFYGLSILDL
jgi:hypothetical protein